jgi:DNA-directed RNA polymerase omega subunit
VAATPSVEGIINPPIDRLLEVVGPLVETRVQEKPLSIALREISERLLSAEHPEV